MKLRSGMVVHCDTEEKASAFLKKCHKQGWKWRGGHNIVGVSGKIEKSYWTFGSNTVYYLRSEGVTHGHIWYTQSDKITPFDELKLNEKKCKIYQMPYFIHEDVEKVIVNEPCVIVFLRSGEKGIAKCCPDDKFEEIHGYSIAYQRATVQRIKNEMKYTKGILNYLTK